MGIESDLNIDGHKLIFHPEKVFEWLKSGDTFPIHIEVGATARCDQHCVFCALDWVKHKGDIDTKIMIDGLKSMSKNNVKSVMFGGEGEPLLHKDISFFIQESKNEGMDVALTTNGSHFTKDKRDQCLPYLSWVKFSVDAGDAKTYAQIHGTNQNNFDKLLHNIDESIKYKHQHNLPVTIGTQFLAIAPNIESAPLLAKILADMGVDYLVIKPYSHHPKSRNDFRLSAEDYNHLEEKISRINIDRLKVLFRGATAQRIEEGRTYSNCDGLSFISLIDSQGNVLPCNLYYDNPEFFYGNLYKQSFEEIWKGSQRKRIIQKIRERGTEDCRNGCRCDVINRYLDRLKKPGPHDNFT